MAILVISSNSRGRPEGHGKRPGLRLAQSLNATGVFSLLDVPSNFYLAGLRGKAYVLWLYLLSAIELIRRRNEEVFFYNCPPAYVPLYLIALVSRSGRPSLLLADGINCIGLRRGEARFFGCFRRIVSLPSNETIDRLLAPSDRFIWFPGLARLPGKAGRSRPSDASRVTLLYNSSLLSHNAPELALYVAAGHRWVEVVVTETESSFRAYLACAGIATCSFPANLRFLGVLTASEYGELMAEVDGVLLCRDESVFWNKYNFPSKLVEALERNLPTISLFPISGVSGGLYFTFDLEAGTEDGVRSYLSSWAKGAFETEKRQFLAMCDARRLRRWVLGETAAAPAA